MIKASETNQVKRQNRKTPIAKLVMVIFLFLLVGLYAIAINNLADNRVAIVAFITPIILLCMLTKFAPRLFLALLILSLPLSARFRFGTIAFHTGGAELAVAPIDFVLIGMLFWWGIESYGKLPKLQLRLTIVEKAFIILVLAHLPSLLIAPSVELALLEILRLLKMGILIAVLKHFIKNRNDLNFVIIILLLSLAVQGALAIIQTQFGAVIGLGFLGERDDVWIVSSGEYVASRAGGTMGHANALAHFFEMTLPLALAITIVKSTPRLSKLALVAFVLGLAGLYFTLSRGGWIGTAFGLLVVFLGNRQWRVKQQRRRLIIFALLALSGMVVFGIILWPDIMQRLAEFNSVSWLFRFRTFRVAFEIINDYPWLGVGANNYLQVSVPYSIDILTAWPNAIVHNAYLLILAEIGVFGFAAFLWFLWNLWRYARKIIRIREPFESSVALGIWAGILALLVHSLVGWLFRYDPVFTIFWFNVGLLVALSNLYRNELQSR